MASNLRLSSLIPAGLIVEHVTENESVIVVSARAKANQRACPRCGKLSSRVHSRYVRAAADLPCAGKQVELRLVARRFVCNALFCQQRIFAERFDDGIIAERARRTSRLECIVHQSWAGAGWSAGSRLCQTADDAGQQRHSAQGGAAESEAADRAAQCYRNR